MHEPMDLSLQIGEILRRRADRESKRRFIVQGVYFAAVILGLLLLAVWVAH